MLFVARNTYILSSDLFMAQSRTALLNSASPCLGCVTWPASKTRNTQHHQPVPPPRPITRSDLLIIGRADQSDGAYVKFQHI